MIFINPFAANTDILVKNKMFCGVTFFICSSAPKPKISANMKWSLGATKFETRCIWLPEIIFHQIFLCSSAPRRLVSEQFLSPKGILTVAVEKSFGRICAWLIDFLQKHSLFDYFSLFPVSYWLLPGFLCCLLWIFACDFYVRVLFIYHTTSDV